MPLKLIPVMIVENASVTAAREGASVKELLNENMRTLISRLQQHAYADGIRLMAAQYKNDYTLLENFTDIRNIPGKVMDLPTKGGVTNTGLALEKALEGLQHKTGYWDKEGISYGRPILLVVTDRDVTPGRNSNWTREKEGELKARYADDYRNAAARIREMEAAGQLTVGAVKVTHIGSARRSNELNALTNDPGNVFQCEALYNSQLNMENVISWLADAVRRSANEPFGNKPKGTVPRGMKRNVGDLNIDSVVCEFLGLTEQE